MSRPEAAYVPPVMQGKMCGASDMHWWTHRAIAMAAHQTVDPPCVQDLSGSFCHFV